MTIFQKASFMIKLIFIFELYDSLIITIKNEIKINFKLDSYRS
jgi:hypothetical protein